MATMNVNLAEILRELNWSLGRTSREINSCIGEDYVGRPTVWDWINNGRVPQQPVPTVLAYLLTEATGRQVTLKWLWQGKAKPSRTWMFANSGTDVPWHVTGIVKLANDWLSAGGDQFMDRRIFLAVSGATLTTPAWEYLESLNRKPVLAGFAAGKGQKITHAMVDVIEQTIRSLQRLDDREGGSAANVSFAHRHFIEIGRLVRSGNAASTAVARRLLSAWAQMAFLVGYMAHDAARHGLAQRYYRTGLSAAQQAGDQALGAQILVRMAFHAADRGKLRDASELGNAAVIGAQPLTPAVRANVSVLFAKVQAALGNEFAVRAATDEAMELQRSADTRPDWMYYFDERDVAQSMGNALLRLSLNAGYAPARLLSEADTLLNHAYEPRAREDLLDCAWYATAQAHANDVDGALATGWRCLDGLRQVRPARVAAQFQALDAQLARRPSPQVNAFRSELRGVLAGS